MTRVRSLTEHRRKQGRPLIDAQMQAGNLEAEAAAAVEAVREALLASYPDDTPQGPVLAARAYAALDRVHDALGVLTLALEDAGHVRKPRCVPLQKTSYAAPPEET